MATAAEKLDPDLWDKVKEHVTAGGKGGEPGQWSARKAQLAVAEYKKRGGRYKGRKTADNHLVQWTREDWGTKSGAPSGETGERYLPRSSRAALTDAEYRRTTAKKRADAAEGRQFSGQPKDIAAKARDARLEDLPRAELLARARRKNIPGRSRMRKAELAAALAGHPA